MSLKSHSGDPSSLIVSGKFSGIVTECATPKIPIFMQIAISAVNVSADIPADFSLSHFKMVKLAILFNRLPCGFLCGEPCRRQTSCVNSGVGDFTPRMYHTDKIIIGRAIKGFGNPGSILHALAINNPIAFLDDDSEHGSLRSPIVLYLVGK